jgi:hypothetical protein
MVRKLLPLSETISTTTSPGSGALLRANAGVAAAMAIVTIPMSV